MMHPDCEVVALSGVTRPGRARVLADKLGIPAAYDSYLEMLDGEELDLVSVASSPDQHHPMTIAALERRIPVLCEKPMALNLAEAQAMVDAAERRQLVNAVDFEFRHLPARTRFKELVSAGFLGELVHFQLTQTMGGLERNLARPMSWLWRAESGGGMLGALGSHMIDMLRWFFGDFHSVSGSLTAHVDVRDGQPATADDSFSFLIRMPGKASGLAQFLSHAHHGFGMRLEAFGTQGTLVLTDNELAGARAGETLSTIPVAPRFDVPGVTYPAEMDRHIPAFVVMVDNLVNALKGTGASGPSRDFATFRDGAAVQAVLDAVRESHRTGRWTEVPRA